MAAFPHTIRLDLLYGPTIPFPRFVGYQALGIVSHELATFGIHGRGGGRFFRRLGSRRLDRSRVVMAAAAMMVALSQGMGARATSGRLDTITVMLELLCLACTLRCNAISEV